MRKNVFSFSKLILAITLVVATLSTAFVGCKSYDDDIKNLQGQIDAIKTKDLADLETQMKAYADAKFNGVVHPVKSVTQVGNKVIIELADGTKYEVPTSVSGGSIPTIEMKKMADGSYELWVDGKKAGDSIVIPDALDPTLTINEKTGELILNNKPTGIFIPKAGSSGSINAYFIKDEVNKSITLHMPDENGNAQDPVTLSYAPSYGELASLAFIPSWLDNGTPRQKFFFAPTTKTTYVGSTPKWTYRYNPSKAVLDGVKWNFLDRRALITRAAGDNEGIISIKGTKVNTDNVVFTVAMMEKSAFESGKKADELKYYKDPTVLPVITTDEFGALAAAKAAFVSTDAEEKQIVSDYLRFTYRDAAPVIINKKVEETRNTHEDLQRAGERLGKNYKVRVVPNASVNNSDSIAYFSAGPIVSGVSAYGKRAAITLPDGTVLPAVNNADSAINKANPKGTEIARDMAVDHVIPYADASGRPYTFDLNGYASDAAKTVLLNKYNTQGEWYKMSALDFDDVKYIYSEVDEGVNIANDADLTDQQAFVSLNGTTATVVGGSSAVGREPIFNVAMVTALGDTLATAYMKFEIQYPKLGNIEKEVAADLHYADLYVGPAEATTTKGGKNILFYAWQDMNKIYEELGLSHDEFRAAYSVGTNLNAKVINAKWGNSVGGAPSTGMNPVFRDSETPGAASGLADSIVLSVIETAEASIKTYTPILRAHPRLKFGEHEYHLIFTPANVAKLPTITIKFKPNIIAPEAPKYNPEYTIGGTSTTKGMVTADDRYKMAKLMSESFVDYLEAWNKLPYGGGSVESGDETTASNPVLGEDYFIPAAKRAYFFAYDYDTTKIGADRFDLVEHYDGYKSNMQILESKLNETFGANGADSTLAFDAIIAGKGTVNESPYMKQFIKLNQRIDTTSVTYSTNFYRVYENSEVLVTPLKVLFLNPLDVTIEPLVLQTLATTDTIKLANRVKVTLKGLNDPLFDGKGLSYKAADNSWDISASWTPWVKAPWDARYGVEKGAENCQVVPIPYTPLPAIGDPYYSLNFGMTRGSGIQVPDLHLVADKAATIKDGNAYPIGTIAWNNGGTVLHEDIVTSKAYVIFMTPYAIGRQEATITLKKNVK